MLTAADSEMAGVVRVYDIGGLAMCWHRWSKWKEFEQEMVMHLRAGVYAASDKPINTLEYWQRRECEKCGYVQRKKVTED